MSLENRKSPGPTEWPLSLSATIMAGALLVALSAAMLRHLAPDFLVPFRVVLLVGALMAGGLAVSWRLRSLEDEFEERIWAAVLVVAGSGLILCCREAMDKKWDSLRMAFGVFTAVAMVGAVVLLLPRVGRRIVASLLILFHFGGILTAVTAVAPHNGQPAPWLPTTVWNLVYRHYLHFAYLNNAYHFYSPEPGPPTLVWFLIEFEGNAKPQWEKLVTRDECATRLKYQRMLALTESTNQHLYSTPLLKLQALAKIRLEAGRKQKDRPEIPMSDYFDLQFQYKEPTDVTKLYLASYVRHVARTIRSSEDPDAKVKRIKVYRLIHQIIYAPQLKSGLSPIDPMFYVAYFDGEYTRDGKLVPTNQPKLYWLERSANGITQPHTEPGQDPFLYWMLPIYRAPKWEGVTPRDLDETIVIDCVSRHAGWSSGLEEQSKK